MRERKVWNEHEDNILRYLKQEKGEKKWSVIARKMEEEYEIRGRSGKQCRERYHNHLHSSIVAAEWTEEQDEVLYSLHEQYGNKWSAISQKLPGRSDNCVKNHFYSKLRKSVRRLNKFISDYLHKTHDYISAKLLSKIVEISQSRFRSTIRVDEETVEYSIDLKNRLYKFENECEVQSLQEEEAARKLIDDIFFLEKNSHKPGKLSRKRTGSFDRQEHLLHPKLCLKLKRSSSNISEVSDCSEDFSISLSSCGSSYEEEMEQTKQLKRSITTRSSKDIFSRNHSDMEDKDPKRSNRKIDKKDTGNGNKSQTQKEDHSVYFQMVDEDFLSGNEECDIRLSTSLIEETGQGKERRSSKESRNSSSNKSNKSSKFKSFDAFCQFDLQMGFHWPMEDHQDGPLESNQIIWRVIEPKEPLKTKVTIEEEDSLIPCLMDEET